MARKKSMEYKRYVIRVKVDDRTHSFICKKFKMLERQIEKMSGSKNAEFFIQVFPQDKEIDGKFVIASSKALGKFAGLYNDKIEW